MAGPQERSANRADNRARRRARRHAGRDVLLRSGRALVRWLPLPVASVLGQAIGFLAWALVPWMRRQTLTNLEIAFGHEKSAAERRRIGRRCYVLAGRGLLAWIVLHRMGRERALARLVVEPSPEVEAIVASGGGAILLTQHSGLFELMGAWLAANLRVVGVGRDAKDDAGTSMLIRMRQEMGVRTIEHGGAREIVRAVREGSIVGMLADQDIRRVNGAFIPFFGKLAHTPVGPATFAVRMKVPILCAVAEWRSLTTHTVRFPEVLRAREDLPPEEAVLELTARCSAAIERSVRRRPEEWLWMHERWRTTPADHPDAPVWPPEARAAARGAAGASAAEGPASAGVRANGRGGA